MTTKHFGGSILPSSDATILKTIEGKHGTLQVKPIVELDTFGLFYTSGTYNSVIAMHPNGYSCYALAQRIIDVWEGKQPAQYAFEQYSYILRCGGMAKNSETMTWIVERQ